MVRKQHPIEILQALEQRSKQSAHGLPQQTEQQTLWSGIGFRIADIKMVSPVNHISEILHYPRLTLVPGTMPWVKGLANIRGTLIPIMDLQNYLGESEIQHKSLSRILVIQQDDLVVGLLVDEVLGLKHFEPEERITRIKKLSPAVKPHIRGAFQQNEEIWHLFDMTTLTTDPQFYKVAV